MTAYEEHKKLLQALDELQQPYESTVAALSQRLTALEQRLTEQAQQSAQCLNELSRQFERLQTRFQTLWKEHENLLRSLTLKQADLGTLVKTCDARLNELPTRAELDEIARSFQELLATLPGCWERLRAIEQNLPPSAPVPYCTDSSDERTRRNASGK